VNARIRVPGSKSETNRAYVLAALSDATTTITGALESRDTALMRAGLSALGVRFSSPSFSAAERPSLSQLVTPPATFTCVPGGIDVGLAGTVLRFLPALAALAPGLTRFYGDARAADRPIAPLLQALRSLGVTITNDRLPFTLQAPNKLDSRAVLLDASASSQFVSALLLAGARYPHGIEIALTGSQPPSRPHIDMTINMLRERKVSLTASATKFSVSPGPISALNQLIAPDLTNAAAFLAAGVLTAGRVEVLDWPETTNQPGDLIRVIISRFGARVERTSNGVVALPDRPLTACDIDLSAASELTPVVAALAAFSRGTTRISGIAHIRGHETDRIAAIVNTLRSVGITANELHDGLAITGATKRLTGTMLATYADHRMAHLAALLGLKVPGVLLDDVATTAKTLPQFPEIWSAMVAGTTGELAGDNKRRQHTSKDQLDES
jgi:3-phosphoshikimate 1-carboxyvinyltransferase